MRTITVRELRQALEDVDQDADEDIDATGNRFIVIR